MIAYIINGKSFGNCVDYVTRRALEEKLFDQTSKRQKSAERKYEANNGDDIFDHLSKDWDLIAASTDIRLYEGRRAIAEDISRPTKLRKPIESPVGHISLDFHPDDAPTMTNERMAEIAIDYMRQMGLEKTPFIIVRHHDKKHPHCHLVFSRVDYEGKILSQTTNFKRNERVCKALNMKFGLNMAKDKRNTNVEKLRGREKTRYEIFNICQQTYVNANITCWNEFVAELKRQRVDVRHKYSASNPRKIVGTFYIKDGRCFPSSKIDKRYTYNGLVTAFKNSEQLRAEVRGDTVANSSQTKQPESPKQKIAKDVSEAIPQSNDVQFSHSSLGGSPQEEQCFALGGGITWPEYRAAHMDLPVREALRRFKALKRGQNPNAMKGGMHL